MGARVNGKMVALRYELKNGDIVEIITSSRQHPSKDWLEFAKTPRARTRIRQWIKRQERDQSVNLGKELLEKGIEQSHLTLTNIMKSDEVLGVAKDLSFQSVQDLLANIGYGKISVNHVIGRIKPKLGIEEDKARSIVSKMVSRIKRKKGTQGIKVRGLDDILVRFGNCCHPLPGESVIGFITRGRGVTIHKRNCPHIIDTDTERLVDVIWEPSNQDVYLARLRVTSMNKKGILADMSSIMAQKDANIIRAEIKTTMDKKGISLFTIEVENYKQLQEIIGSIRKVKHVLLVERI
jgi:GTP pyrophosphokinase